MKQGPAARLQVAASSVGIPLTDVQAGALVSLLDRIALERQNLTAIDEIMDGVDRHLADSIAGLAVAEPAGPLVDIGSGGGFPGLVIARLRPDLAVTLVESEGRKADWLVRASADLPNVRVVPERTEQLARDARGAFGTVTARAVAGPVPTLELAAPLVGDGGEIRMWSTPMSEADDAQIAAAADLLGFVPEGIVPVSPFTGARRVLRRFRRVAPTPDRYPRRPGRAVSRPLRVLGSEAPPT